MEMQTGFYAVTYHGPIGIQICAPAGATDAEVVAFAEGEYPCGTTGGWQIRREGDAALDGDAERVACVQREGYVHIMLGA